MNFPITILHINKNTMMLIPQYTYYKEANQMNENNIYKTT